MIDGPNSGTGRVRDSTLTPNLPDITVCICKSQVYYEALTLWHDLQQSCLLRSLDMWYIWTFLLIPIKRDSNNGNKQKTPRQEQIPTTNQRWLFFLHSPHKRINYSIYYSKEMFNCLLDLLLAFSNLWLWIQQSLGILLREKIHLSY